MNKINQKGYALLFTVVIVSIISLLVVGLSNTTLKHLILSLGAKDSQLAFFQSDMAVECALYADIANGGDILLNQNSFFCGIDNNGLVYKLNKTKIVNSTEEIYTFTKEMISTQKNTDPCFEIKIIKTNDGVDTQIFASGYNICKKDDTRTVERTIEIKY